jgi:hypothetical protein
MPLGSHVRDLPQHPAAVFTPKRLQPLTRFIDQKFASLRLDLAHQPHFIRGGCRHHAFQEFQQRFRRMNAKDLRHFAVFEEIERSGEHFV